MASPEVQKVKPSNIMQLLDVFKYGGSTVVIRRWFNCYEYLLVHHGELFCDYVEYEKKNYQPSNEELEGIRDHLRSGAINTIDFHNRERSAKNQIKKLIKHVYEKGIKPRAAQ